MVGGTASPIPAGRQFDPSIDTEVAAGALSLLLGAIGLVVLDLRIERIDLLSDPVGFALAVVGVRRLRRSTPRSAWSLLLVVLAPVAVVTSLLAEVGAVRHGTATGFSASATVPATAPDWVGTAAIASAVLSVLGVLVLARHLRGVLGGVASDRWRQVTISWVAFVTLGVVALATAAIELIVLAAAAGVTAATLVVLSLLATRRLLEEAPPTGRPGVEAFL